MAVGVALPDHVDVAGRQIDRRACQHAAADVVQYAVTHIDGVIQSNDAPRCAVPFREVLEHPFAAKTTHRIFAHRSGRVGLARAALRDAGERIDVAGGEGDDPTVTEGLGDDGRHRDVHRPGQRQRSGRAELAPGHEHDVRASGQRRDRLTIHEIAGYRLDVARLQFFPDRRIGEARDADNAPVWRSAFGEPRQRQPHLAADAENQDIARDRFEIMYQGGRGPGHEFFECRLVAEPCGQFGRVVLCHRSVSVTPSRQAGLRRSDAAGGLPVSSGIPNPAIPTGFWE